MPTSTSIKSRSLKPIGITTGDHRGIGPEVISKGLAQLERKELPRHSVVIFGSPELYSPYRRLLRGSWRRWSEAEFASPNWPGPDRDHWNFVLPEVGGRSSSDAAAFLCGRYIELAALACLQGKLSAMATGPIDKSELHRGGYPFDGHTELLQAVCKSPSVTMMMAGPLLRTTLVTVHLALKDVSASLSVDKILTCVANTHDGLRRDFGIKRPRLAVLGLNPHASDRGLFGDEEARIIEPAILAARKRYPGAKIDGPFPTDGFFAQWRKRYSKDFDAVICMYHDQGLIPAKLLDFENTVNVSLGLPIVRTSVDHGIGLDIAGKNKADPSSFRAALSLALEMVSRRRRQK